MPRVLQSTTGHTREICPTRGTKDVGWGVVKRSLEVQSLELQPEQRTPLLGKPLRLETAAEWNEAGVANVARQRCVCEFNSVVNVRWQATT